MPELIPVLPKEEIEDAVAAVAHEISLDYAGKAPVLIGVLKGAFIFLADLIRKLNIPVQIDFLQVASYGDGTASSGKITITKEIGIDIRNRHVLIVEDIVDTGLTLAFLIEYLNRFGPKTIRVCALIDKTERRACEVAVDYSGRKVPEGFIVGYGLDFAEDYRHLPGIYHLKS